MNKILTLVVIVFMAIALARWDPPNAQAVVQNSDSKAVQQPENKKMDPNPSEQLKSHSEAVAKPSTQNESRPARVLTQPEQWMQAAGIAESDWKYVDCVVSGCGVINPEGNWDGVQKWNSAGSGAYGLCQSLPANKMASEGPDWQTNPVTQLRWCHKHAMGYGSWAAAWEFRQCVGMCFSNVAQRIIEKDHTWW